MAIEVARYPRLSKAVVHRPPCTVWTTSVRIRQVSPAVEVPDGWTVEGCQQCIPRFAVIEVGHCHVEGRDAQMERRFTRREERRRLRLDEVDAHASEREGWRAAAACASSDERLGSWLSWLYTADTGQRWQTDLAKAICASCPVRVDCVTVGVWGEEPWGVWGGATPRERKLLLSRWRKEGRVDGRLAESVVAAVG